MTSTTRLARHLASAVKALSPAAALGLTLAAIFGGVGVADAASTAFVLGKSNPESSTATLTNSRGTPLDLGAPKNTAPFSVSGRTVVRNLNAQFVGGLSAFNSQSTGGDGFVRPDTNIPLGTDTFAKVASTGKLPAGSYYVTATAMIDLTADDTGAFCVIEEPGKESTFGNGGADGVAFVQALETTAIRLKAPAQLQEWCIVSGAMAGSEAIDAGITAVRIITSKGKKPQVNGVGLSATPASHRPAK